MKAFLVDTGILYALFAANDRWHERARLFVNGYPGKLIVTACVIPETVNLVNKFLGQRAETVLVNAVAQVELGVEELQTRD